MKKINTGLNIGLKEPRDRDSFEHTLWKIIGGEEGNFYYAAYNLGISMDVLAGVTRGHIKPSQKSLHASQWREKLAHNYPKTWPYNEKSFDKYVKQLPAEENYISDKYIGYKPSPAVLKFKPCNTLEPKNNRSENHKMQDVHTKVAHAIQRLLTFKSMKVEELETQMSDLAFLRKKWDMLSTGSAKIEGPFFHVAAAILVERYQITRNHPAYPDFERAGIPPHYDNSPK